jgi:hypothetical protein
LIRWAVVIAALVVLLGCSRDLSADECAVRRMLEVEPYCPEEQERGADPRRVAEIVTNCQTVEPKPRFCPR